MMRLKSAVLFSSIILIILSSTYVLAASSFGQTAGPLHFGEVARGGSSTLTYGVINSDPDNKIRITTGIDGNISSVVEVFPDTIIVSPSSEQTITVTVNIPRKVDAGTQWDGFIRVVSGPVGDQAETKGVGATIALGALKEVSVVASFEMAERNIPTLPILLVIIIALLAIASYTFYLKR